MGGQAHKRVECWCSVPRSIVSQLLAKGCQKLQSYFLTIKKRERRERKEGGERDVKREEEGRESVRECLRKFQSMSSNHKIVCVSAYCPRPYLQ